MAYKDQDRKVLNETKNYLANRQVCIDCGGLRSASSGQRCSDCFKALVERNAENREKIKQLSGEIYCLKSERAQLLEQIKAEELFLKFITKLVMGSFRKDSRSKQRLPDETIIKSITSRLIAQVVIEYDYEEKEPVIHRRVGFCSHCLITRLSVENTNGLCDECSVEANREIIEIDPSKFERQDRAIKAYTLRHDEGLTIQEIANQLGVTKQAVSAMLKRYENKLVSEEM